MNRATFSEETIDSIFASLNQCHLPGAAVGVALDAKLVYRKGFGLASMELPVVLTPTTRMRIGSVTKQFACLAYLLLCEEGLANVDDPIGKHLQGLHPSAQSITVRQLMSHTSGLRDVCEITLQFSGAGRRVRADDLLALYREIDDVNCRPGTAWIYNNGAYLMLSAAIELISGQPLEEVLRKRICEPLGMYDTELRRFDDDFRPNSAVPHMTSGDRKFEKSYYGMDFAGAGGMVSTVDDMLRWLAHMDTPKVGSESTWAAMTDNQTLENGTPTGYGFGLISSQYRGLSTVSHPGGWSGGNAQILKVPTAGLDIAIMVNRHDVLGMEFVAQILDVCLPNLEPLLEGSSGPFATGVFRSEKTGRVVELFGQDGRQIVSIDGYNWPFARHADGALRPIAIWSYLKRKVTLAGDEKQPAEIDFEDFGNWDRLTRQAPVDTAHESAIIGTYRSKAIQTNAMIFESNGHVRMKTAGRFGSAEFDLQCLADGIWRAKQLSALASESILSFEDKSGAFRFSSWNTWGLKFQRAA